MILSSWSSRGFEVNWGTIALVGSPEQTPRVARGRENAARRSPWTLKWSRPKNSKKCGRVVQKYGCQEKGILRYWVADSWHPYFFDDLVEPRGAKWTPKWAKRVQKGVETELKGPSWQTRRRGGSTWANNCLKNRVPAGVPFVHSYGVWSTFLCLQ